MNKLVRISIFIIIISVLYSCEKFMEPEPVNTIDEQYLLKNPAAAEGILLRAYIALPGSDYSSFGIESASDDAVTNDFDLDYWDMTNGRWTSAYNPVSGWGAYDQIFYINYFLQIKDGVEWDFDSEIVKQQHLQRLSGEAFGLRAYYEFKLLQGHSGIGTDGILLGFPLILKSMDTNDNWEVPRGTFEACVNQILSDCDSALAYLPSKYEDIEGDNAYNITLGGRFTNRMNGDAVQALKSRLLLFAASPAYNTTDDVGKWIDAANAAGELLNENGGLLSVSDSAVFWIYPSGGPVDRDVIWGSSIVLSTIDNIEEGKTIESKNFPPSLFGQAQVNPTQELVDAFPMANGYPIDDPLSGYDENYPYNNRDPRLENFIIRDSSVFGDKGLIRTHLDDPVNGIDAQNNSTRTGYYLRKFLLDNVVLDPDKPSGWIHFYTYFRFTEVWLNYAEAANEAWGPDGGGSIGVSARQSIGAIRQRAGIMQPDNYLSSIATKEEMRVLIRNERRLELCFEGHRFYDIRRWVDITTMKASVSGVRVTPGTPNLYEYFTVEPRKYQDYMIYGPIPFEETIKYDLQQNQGW